MAPPGDVFVMSCFTRRGAGAERRIGVPQNTSTHWMGLKTTPSGDSWSCRVVFLFEDGLLPLQFGHHMDPPS